MKLDRDQLYYVDMALRSLLRSGTLSRIERDAASRLQHKVMCEILYPSMVDVTRKDDEKTNEDEVAVEMRVAETP